MLCCCICVGRIWHPDGKRSYLKPISVFASIWRQGALTVFCLIFFNKAAGCCAVAYLLVVGRIWHPDGKRSYPKTISVFADKVFSSMICFVYVNIGAECFGCDLFYDLKSDIFKFFSLYSRLSKSRTPIGTETKFERSTCSN